MHKLFTATVVAALAVALVATPVLAATHTFKLFRDGKINGTTLEPGKYKLEFSDSEAKIYQGKTLVTTSPIEVKQNGGNSRANSRASVLQDADGNIIEVRTKKQIVVFVR
jgi:hypothetical protein